MLLQFEERLFVLVEYLLIESDLKFCYHLPSVVLLAKHVCLHLVDYPKPLKTFQTSL